MKANLLAWPREDFEKETMRKTHLHLILERLTKQPQTGLTFVNRRQLRSHPKTTFIHLKMPCAWVLKVGGEHPLRAHSRLD